MKKFLSLFMGLILVMSASANKSLAECNCGCDCPNQKNCIKSQMLKMRDSVDESVDTKIIQPTKDGYYQLKTTTL